MTWGPQGHFVKDLDQLPFPDREIFPYDEMLRQRAARLMGLEFMATRGCVYRCRYCLNPLLRKVHGKGCVRRRSAGHLLDEMEEVVGRYGYKGIIGFHDDIFTLSPDWLMQFASAYPERIGLPFWCNAHVAELTEPVDPASFLLGRAFQAAGWLGAQIRPGVWCARCPNECAHTTGSTFDSSTVLFAPRPGHSRGLFFCSHGHCRGRLL